MLRNTAISFSLHSYHSRNTFVSSPMLFSIYIVSFIGKYLPLFLNVLLQVDNNWTDVVRTGRCIQVGAYLFYHALERPRFLIPS